MKFMDGLALLFIGLKLTHYIDWEWWIVLSPTLAQLGLNILILVVNKLILVLEKKDNERLL